MPPDAMNCVDRQALTLVHIVDLKWLLAGEGRHVHVERLQRDPVYAAECLQWAAESSNRHVRDAGVRLAQHLQAGRSPAA